MILQCAIMCCATQKILLGIQCTASLTGPRKDLEKIMDCPKFESFQNNSYQASSKTVIPKTITCVNINTPRKPSKVQIPGLNQSF